MAQAAPSDLNTTFGTIGIVSTAGVTGVGGLAVLSDGKIIAAGGNSSNFSVARYNTNGTLDTTFSSDGLVQTPFPPGGSYASDVAIQSNGKIVVAGYNQDAGSTYFAVARYNINGSLDTTFSGDGRVTTGANTASTSAYASSVAVQSDGKILAGGNVFIIRYIGDTVALSAPATSPSGSSS